MADKKLNELGTAIDASYIYAEASNGTQVRISKADLALVVAEQAFYSPKETLSGDGSISNSLPCGIYMLNNRLVYGEYMSGILLSFFSGGNKMFIAIGNDVIKIYQNGKTWKVFEANR